MEQERTFSAIAADLMRTLLLGGDRNSMKKVFSDYIYRRQIESDGDSIKAIDELIRFARTPEGKRADITSLVLNIASPILKEHHAMRYYQSREAPWLVSHVLEQAQDALERGLSQVAQDLFSNVLELAVAAGDPLYLPAVTKLYETNYERKEQGHNDWKIWAISNGMLQRAREKLREHYDRSVERTSEPIHAFFRKHGVTTEISTTADFPDRIELPDNAKMHEVSRAEVLVRVVPRDKCRESVVGILRECKIFAHRVRNMDRGGDGIWVDKFTYDSDANVFRAALWPHRDYPYGRKHYRLSMIHYPNGDMNPGTEIFDIDRFVEVVPESYEA